jgi:hypothetical protein
VGGAPRFGWLPPAERTAQRAVWELPRVDPHPYHGRLSPGVYRVSAQINPPTPPFFDSSKHFEVVPPNKPMRLRIGP